MVFISSVHPASISLDYVQWLAMLLIIGMLVTCARQPELSSSLSAQNVAGIVFGIPQYPDFFVSATVFVNKGDDFARSMHIRNHLISL